MYRTTKFKGEKQNNNPFDLRETYRNKADIFSSSEEQETSKTNFEKTNKNWIQKPKISCHLKISEKNSLKEFSINHPAFTQYYDKTTVHEEKEITSIFI